MISSIHVQHARLLGGRECFVLSDGASGQVLAVRDALMRPFDQPADMAYLDYMPLCDLGLVPNAALMNPETIPGTGESDFHDRVRACVAGVCDGFLHGMHPR